MVILVLTLQGWHGKAEAIIFFFFFALPSLTYHASEIASPSSNFKIPRICFFFLFPLTLP